MADGGREGTEADCRGARGCGGGKSQSGLEGLTGGGAVYSGNRQRSEAARAQSSTLLQRAAAAPLAESRHSFSCPRATRSSKRVRVQRTGRRKRGSRHTERPAFGESGRDGTQR